MSETVKTEQVYYTKDFDNYTNSENNFVVNQELTVTITLNEYRKLISDVALSTKKIDSAKHELFVSQQENEKLKSEIKDLKDRLLAKSVQPNSDEEDDNNDDEDDE